MSSIHLIAWAQSLLAGRSPAAFPTPQRAVLRPVLRIGDVEVDLESHRATRAGRDVHLSPTEYRILVLFMGDTGRVFSRQQLLMGAADDRPNTELGAADVYVTGLRRKLNRGFNRDALKTLRGVGYTGLGPAAARVARAALRSAAIVTGFA